MWLRVLFFIFFIKIVLSETDINNEVDIWHTEEFIALTRPGDTPFKKCLLHLKKGHAVYCNKYYECDAAESANTDEVVYTEKICGPEMNFDVILSQCKPYYEVDCNNRL